MTSPAELRKLLEAATERPWCWDDRGDKCSDVQFGVALDSKDNQIAGYFEQEDVEYVDHVGEICSGREDAALIVAAVNALPDLLDALAAAERERDAVLEEAAAICRRCSYAAPCADEILALKEKR